MSISHLGKSLFKGCNIATLSCTLVHENNRGEQVVDVYRRLTWPKLDTAANRTDLFNNNTGSEESRIPAMEGQWEFFLTSVKSKADSHTKAARFWARVDTFFGLSLIFLSASTTALALLDGVPKEVVAGVGAMSTMLAAASSFLKSADRRQIHDKTSRAFRSLMVKMVSCDSEVDYEKYWADFNREIMDEPIMSEKYTKKLRVKYIMTPELQEIVEQKELTIAEVEHKKLIEQEAALAAEKAAEEEAEELLAQSLRESEKCESPRKDKWQSIIEIPDIASMSHKMFGGHRKLNNLADV